MKKIFPAFISSLILLFSPAFANTVSADTQNNSSDFGIQDIFDLRSFLLSGNAKENNSLQSKSFDLTKDNVWDISDLCMMKRDYLKNKQPESTKNVLVAYFSRTGNTEKIAKYIVNSANADTFVINASVPYTDEDISYNNSSCRANLEQKDKNARPEIAETIENMDNYDVIFLGYPIWWGEEPRIIDTFLESYDFSGKTVIPFCTSGGSGISTSEKNIGELVTIGKQLEGKRFSSSASEQEVDDWVKSFNLSENSEQTQINIEVNNHTLTATLADNSSAEAFAELLKKEPLTIEMDDYSNFEKVGTLPEALPRNDEKINTDAGDLILYQGNKFVMYYDTNSWTFTRLGHLNDISKSELQQILGEGSVTVTISLTEN